MTTTNHTDSRGLLHTVTAAAWVDGDQDVTLDCGHKPNLTTHFSLPRIGEQLRCYACKVAVAETANPSGV